MAGPTSTRATLVPGVPFQVQGPDVTETYSVVPPVPQMPPVDTMERWAGAVLRQGIKEMSKGGSRGLWAAVVLLGALIVGQWTAFAIHIAGDGSVREEARSTRVLVLWLVRRAHAEDNGLPPPAFPYDEL
jgi:hypothetical protein